MSAAAGFVWDPRLASHVYRSDHPLKPWRLQGVHDTLERLGTFALPNARVLEPRLATRAELERIHDPAYVEAIEHASEDPELDYTAWGLSAWGDTPPFAGMHEASLLTTGATLVAMEDVVAGRARVAFNGSGGLHHAMRRNASGFCIYNDPAIVCGLLADRGMKVAYVDIDAHHGDGVQAAFYDTAQVLTISLHEFGMIPRLGRPFFPGTGSADERGTGKGAGYSVAFALPNARVLEPRLATRAELERIHDPAYVEAIEHASEDPELDYTAWGLSAWGDTPPFAGMHEASLLTTGATLVAMEDVVAGRARVAFNGSGGLHHAMRRNASGFCIYNDPAIVCGLLADRGMKVAYVDIDAHHGDGVQAAFYDTAQVLTISLHEFGMIPRLGRPFFPGTGSADERGTGKGAGYSVNVALPAYTDDLAYMRAFDAVVPPLLDRFRPDILVTQQGIDAHFTDPLTDLQLSTHAREHVVSWFASTPYPWVAMGGGGYDLDAVRRTWSMEYLIMLGAPVPESLHDEDPPVLGGRARTAVDAATDQATREALTSAFR
ncbi:MAG: hypothetical protein E6I66_07390 [Chloroflexi bacterium]|nr:MAG: hypothetical protein E6I66_07390 [Chloroflexota bacterium]